MASFLMFHTVLTTYVKNKDIRFVPTQTSIVSKQAHETGHSLIWNEVKFIDRDPHWYTPWAKELSTKLTSDLHSDE